MLQLDILSGTQAGTQFVSRRFPFTVGRSQEDDLHLSEPGVWDRHLTIDLVRSEKAFRIACQKNASLAINGENRQEATLCNGDLLQIGGAKLRVGLTAPRQKSLVLRETAIWIFLGFLCLAQVAVIYLLSS